jgi:hypothetical protein
MDGMNKLFIILLILTCMCCSKKEPFKYICIEFTSNDDISEIKRGIEWWNSPIEYQCNDISIIIRSGQAPPDKPMAYGWYDGKQIVWVKGDIFKIIQHEWGHVLGYEDSSYGVMSCGEVPMPLLD